MSNLILPKFQGWSYKKTITPIWNTQTYESQSGRETRIQKWKYPRYEIKLNYNFMTDETTQTTVLDKGDIERMQGFFNAVAGSFDDFLYFDDTENFVENQTFGIGDGQTTQFQLVRNHPYWAEPVNGINEKPQIFVNGIEAECEVDAYGVVSFVEPPEADAILSWTGNYYFRVRFSEDQLDLGRTWNGLWEGIELSMKTVK